MKVSIDQDLCLGCGVCESIAPEIFSLEEEPYAVVILDPVPSALLHQVEDAVAECPEEAISFVE